jgi:threonine dehydrogenase-like Zn-dependent dehydrogenase
VDILETAQPSQSLWLEAAGTASLRRAPLPPRQPGEVTIRSLYGGISRGTEALVFSGHVPPSEYERMRGPHQKGNFPFPVQYGYASVGIVEEGPPPLRGKAVFCLHPHQDRYRVAAADVHLIPETVDPPRAVLAANMETALNIVWDAGIQPGDRVAVFGAGVVGLLTAWLSTGIIGTETIVSDTDPSRREIAGDLGVAFSAPSELPCDCDVLINASASAQALSCAIEHAGFEARIVEASWYGEHSAEIPLGGAFHARRLSIVSSQVGAIAASRRARWDFDRRLSKALQLLSDPRLDRLISGETPFSELAEHYGDILAASSTLCHRIRY